MVLYAIVEGHGETDAVENLLTRLIREHDHPFSHVAPCIRGLRVHQEVGIRRAAELVRAKSDARALLILTDDEDGCPREDGPQRANWLRPLNLPFPAAIVLAYREYESLFLPCVSLLAGQPLRGPGGIERPGLRAGTTYVGDFEARRGVKEWLSQQMPAGRAYKPTVDQLPLTRLVDLGVVRASGLPWFGTLERALAFLAGHLDQPGAVYPGPR